jgi:hypothetical protein
MTNSAARSSERTPGRPERGLASRHGAAAARGGLLAVVLAGLVAGSSLSAAAAPLPAWKTQAMPKVSNAVLSGVSCATPDRCVAVGSHTGGALAESWNGTGWTVDSLPLPANGQYSGLGAVSCLTATTCVAVGYAKLAYFTPPISEVSSGGKWKLVPFPAQPKGQDATLVAVSCWAANGCFAVGAIDNPSGTPTAPLSAVFNGTSWSKVGIATPKGVRPQLSGVSCLPATVPPLCDAVGAVTNGGVTSPLVELANSTHGWQQIAVPAVHASYTNLSSVSCTAPDMCLAVGNTGTVFHQGPFSLVDNGGKWSAVAVPKPAHSGGIDFEAVSCPQVTNNCQAVGRVSVPDGASGTPLAEDFVGGKWSVAPVPAPSSLSGLEAVSCAMPTSAADQAPCTAVGTYNLDPQAPQEAFAVRR